MRENRFFALIEYTMELRYESWAVKMEYSQFNIYINDYPQSGYTLVYNTLSRQVMCVNTAKMYSPSAKILEKMKKLGIAIESLDAEKEAAKENYYQNLFNKDELRIILVLTRKCNCRCIYCYEDAQGASFPDVTDAGKIIRFIERTMEEKKLCKLRIIFYGGEPLLRREKITEFSLYFFKKLKSQYRFSIITNGTLLKREDVCRWKEVGLESIKVTIDGDALSHNSRRPYANLTGTYYDILNRLAAVKEDVHIVLNIVIDAEISGVDKLIEEIAERGIQPEYALSFREPCICLPGEKARIVIQYAKLLKEKGAFQSTKIAFDHGTMCMGKDENYFVLDGRGLVYQCNGNFSSVIGTLSNITSKPPKKKLSDDCLECAFLPICNGGCLYEHRCEKEYFALVVPELIKIYTEVIQ